MGTFTIVTSVVVNSNNSQSVSLWQLGLTCDEVQRLIMPLRPLLHLNRPPKTLCASKHLLSGLSSFSNCDSVVSLLVVSLATINLFLHCPVIAPSLKYESFTGVVVSTRSHSCDISLCFSSPAVSYYICQQLHKFGLHLTMCSLHFIKVQKQGL